MILKINLLKKNFGSKDRKIIAKNISWLFVAEIGSRIARGVLTIIAARMLGASTFGIFTYALALGGIITFFEDAGIGIFTTREMTKSPEEKEKIFESLFNIKIILIIIGIIIFIFFGSIFSIGTESFLLIIAISLILLTDSLQGFFISTIRSEQKMEKESYIKIGTSLSVFLLGLIFITIKPTAINLALGYAIGGIIGLTISSYFVKSYLKNHKIFYIKKIYLKKVLKSSWPYTIVFMSSLMILNIDTIFLGQITNTETVGQYSAANRLVQLFYIIPQIITIAIFPNIIQKLHNSTSNNSVNIFNKTSLITGMIAIICIIGSFIFAKWIIPLIFGQEYIPAIPIFLILTIGFIPVFLGQVFNYFIFALDNQKRFVAINIIGFLINVTLNILLIPRYGANGAAIATIVSLFIIHISTGIKLKGILIRNTLKKI